MTPTPNPTAGPQPVASTLAIVAAIVAILAMLTAAALLVSGDQALAKLGIVAAAVGLVIPALVALLRADQAAKSTNGTFHATAALAEAFRAELPVSVATAVVAAQANLTNGNGGGNALPTQ